MNRELINIETKYDEKTNKVNVTISHDSFTKSIKKSITKYLHEPLNEETKEKLEHTIMETINQYIVFKK